MTKKIDITELILRDAHQSLMATRMSLEDMVPACEDLDKAGYWSVECWGGATFDSCIRFLNEDPWERLRTFRKLMPNTRLQMLLRGQNLLGTATTKTGGGPLRRKGGRERDRRIPRLRRPQRHPQPRARAVAAVRRTGKHAQGAISYTVSPLHTIEGFVDLARSCWTAAATRSASRTWRRC